MPLPKEALEGLIDLMVSKGNLDRTESRVVVETAHHAATEAMETAARICIALDHPTHIVVALALAAKIVQAAAEVECAALRDLAVEMSGKGRSHG